MELELHSIKKTVHQSEWINNAIKSASISNRFLLQDAEFSLPGTITFTDLKTSLPSPNKNHFPSQDSHHSIHILHPLVNFSKHLFIYRKCIINILHTKRLKEEVTTFKTLIEKRKTSIKTLFKLLFTYTCKNILPQDSEKTFCLFGLDVKTNLPG